MKQTIITIKKDGEMTHKARTGSSRNAVYHSTWSEPTYTVHRRIVDHDKKDIFDAGSFRYDVPLHKIKAMGLEYRIPKD